MSRNLSKLESINGKWNPKGNRYEFFPFGVAGFYISKEMLRDVEEELVMNLIGKRLEALAEAFYDLGFKEGVRFQNEET